MQHAVRVGDLQQVEEHHDAGPVGPEEQIHVADDVGRGRGLGAEARLDVEPVEALDLLDGEPVVGVDDLSREDEEGAALLGTEFVEEHGRGEREPR